MPSVVGGSTDDSPDARFKYSVLHWRQILGSMAVGVDAFDLVTSSSLELALETWERLQPDTTYREGSCDHN